MNASYYTLKRRLGNNKLSFRDSLKSHSRRVCPGCNAHRKVVGDKKGEILFKRYVNSPQRSYIMYWRSHQREYTIMCSL